ncbi:ATP-dependent DNA helicase, RecQ family [Candidatus Vecturithrix granuli]|uniref:DNA 3'-5' helicase n=1 Tax=Vecturithrix granuli TaxID=1499967 RepID=A0A0S6WC15_VECG1|nr:ATP-dependent DNA helicase, RecQ family [Candidatus Vecturithrix granuli]
MLTDYIRDFRELFKIIAEAQHAGLVTLYRKIIVEITKKKQAEVQYCVRHDVPSPILEGAYAFIESLLATIPDKKPLFVDHALLQLRFARIAETYYDAEKWGWIEDPNPEHLREKRRLQARKDYEDLTRRQKTLFKFMQSAARVSVAAFIDDRDQQLKHILRRRRPFNKAWLARLKGLSHRLLHSIYQQKSLQGQNINLIHALIELDVPDHDIEVLEQVLKFLKGMGYIRIYTEPLIPMAIELFLHSRQKIEAEPQHSSEDYETFEAFQENRRLRELRLAALETLHALEIERERQQFIQDYFACQESGQILALIEKTLPSNSEILGRIREEALNVEEQNLSEEQRTVYEAPPGQSVVVTAGPGSGKTHTLLLRLARLIHKDHIAPDTMLVLAYNRAVVEEIKHRLHELMGQLGYRHLAKGLKVFTFHGLIKYCIPDIIRDIPIGDEWENVFLDTFQRTPGLIRQRLGAIRYVFVDEFHDMTMRRYRLLQFIAPPQNAHVFAIGDPNQSIYGHQRCAAGERWEAEPYFERLIAEYQAAAYHLRKNFRSFSHIIQAAEELVALNHGRLSPGSLAAVRTPSPAWAQHANYVEANDAHNLPWFQAVRKLLHETRADGAPYRHIAILFRSNLEVYRAFTELKKALQGVNTASVTIRVQGEGIQFARLREVEYFLDAFRARAEKPLPQNVVDDFLKDCQSLPACWHQDFLQILHALLLEFQNTRYDSATFGDLVEYIEDIGRSDAGQIYKIYQFWQPHKVLDRDLPGQQSTDIVLSSIHKVKGLEFDAVVIPASIADLPFAHSPASRADLQSIFAEERRIYYVGMTRARDRLLLFRSKREECLQKNQSFSLSSDQKSQLGVGFNAGIDNLFISHNANQTFIRSYAQLSEEAFLRYIERKIAIGDPLTLQRIRQCWYLVHKGTPVGRLSQKAARKLNPSTAYTGLEVTQVVRYSYQQSLASDEKHRQHGRSSHFADMWSPYFRQKGWSYLVDFCGYAQPSLF